MSLLLNGGLQSYVDEPDQDGDPESESANRDRKHDSEKVYIEVRPEPSAEPEHPTGTNLESQALAPRIVPREHLQHSRCSNAAQMSTD